MIEIFHFLKFQELINELVKNIFHWGTQNPEGYQPHLMTKPPPPPPPPPTPPPKKKKKKKKISAYKNSQILTQPFSIPKKLTPKSQAKLKTSFSCVPIYIHTVLQDTFLLACFIVYTLGHFSLSLFYSLRFGTLFHKKKFLASIAALWSTMSIDTHKIHTNETRINHKIKPEINFLQFSQIL